jgi:autotransporter-associated beta strand protein
VSNGIQVAMVQRVGRAGLGIMIAGAVAVQALLAVGPMPASAADLVWVGNDGNSIGNFTLSGNWENNTLPSWGYGNSLKFQQNQNVGVTTLNYNWEEWRQANDIFWDTTFPASRTLSSSSGFGIDYKQRIENNSFFPQTVAMLLSGGKDGVAGMELNPVNGSLTISGTIYNDNALDYTVYGSQSGTNPTSLTLTSALGPNAAPQSNVDFTVSDSRFSNVLVNASQVWAGTTTVNSGSFITGSGVTLASSAIVIGGGTVATTSANTLADAATLTVNSGRLSIGGNDTVASLSGTGGTVNLATGATLTAGGAGSTSYAGSITGSGGFTKVGSGTFTLSAANGYTGATTVNAGRLSLASANLLADSSAVTGIAGASLALGGNETIGSLAGSLDVALGSSTLTVGGDNTSTTHSGNINGAGGLTKVGAGTFAVTGSNGYGGATQVNAGTLRVNGILGATSSVSVAAAATLSGTGTIAGATTIAGIHSPGNSPGVQTFNANLTYSAGSIITWELIANTTGASGTDYDQIVIPTSNLAFAGSTTLDLSFNSAGSAVDWTNAFWNVNRSWIVLDLSSGVTTGINNLAIGGSLLDSLGNTLNPSTRGSFSVAQSGQDVVLNFVAVPEPATCGLAIVGLGLAAAIGRLGRKARNEPR